MNRYIMEEFYRDPALLHRLQAQAMRERNRAIGAAFRKGLAALVRLGRRLLPRFDVRPAHWMERLG